MKYFYIALSLIAVPLAGYFFRFGSPSGPAAPANVTVSLGSIPASSVNSASPGRNVSSLPGAKGRILTNANPIERLDRESDGKWNLKRDRTGVVKRMSGGSLPLGSKAPSVAADEFLRRYGEGLLGVSAASLVPGESRQEGVTAQVIYAQEKEGLPVFGSRINMIFDREGNLVHLVSDIHGGVFPSATPRIDVSTAAATVRLGVAQRLARDGEQLADDAFPGGELESWAVLGYRMSAGVATLVYRFHFSLADSRYGDLEAIVDAQSGALTALKTISKN